MEKEKQPKNSGFITLGVDNVNKELQGDLNFQAEMTLQQVTALGIVLGNAASEQNIKNEAPLKILETLEDIVKIANFYKKEANDFYKKMQEWEAQYYTLKEKNQITITLDEFLKTKSKNEGLTDAERFKKDYEKVRRQLKIAKIL